MRREHEVRRLDQAEPAVAGGIWRVMQAAYAVEAALLGVEDFAPLRRTAAEVAGSASVFLGLGGASDPVAVAELETAEDVKVNIASLVVSPAQFRRGHATRLLRHVVEVYGEGGLTVSTGRANTPAVRLYERHGFQVQRYWETPCGIAMVTFFGGSAGAGG